MRTVVKIYREYVGLRIQEACDNIGIVGETIEGISGFLCVESRKESMKRMSATGGFTCLH